MSSAGSSKSNICAFSAIHSRWVGEDLIELMDVEVGVVRAHGRVRRKAVSLYASVSA
jgi:hypothetical protein